MAPIAKKIIGISSVVIVLALAIFLYFRFWFVYAEGQDTGTLNYFSCQGIVFKTYEGKLIQEGNKKMMESNEFRFSVDDEQVADQLMRSTGKTVEVHYQRFFSPLIWRGESVFVVDSVCSIR